MRVCHLEDIPVDVQLFMLGVAFPNGEFNCALFTTQERRDREIELYKKNVFRGDVPGLNAGNFDFCIHTRDNIPKDSALRSMKSHEFYVFCDNEEPYGILVGDTL